MWTSVGTGMCFFARFGGFRESSGEIRGDASATYQRLPVRAV
ncbi:hypothetical protein RESH_03505 [Rhodopirellula europaea SH398]|uniref:Uncharacterized protein n=1 Tax=Rhodopirellula europaea SH398 TaxID=1263868 RepID=M5SI66_9BACT|nr:hypothetical protein RESH_03505 [Rhodopirellula europaea SH398]